MDLKRIFRPVFLIAVACSLSAQHAELSQIQTVYLLPMGNGFDQYLANQLTKLGPYRVVTDPQGAEAIFTDRLGEAFEAKFKELFPPPAPEPIAEEKDKDKDKDGDKKEATAKKADTNERFVPPSSFSRGKGTVFLVERSSASPC